MWNRAIVGQNLFARWPRAGQWDRYPRRLNPIRPTAAYSSTRLIVSIRSKHFGTTSKIKKETYTYHVQTERKRRNTVKGVSMYLLAFLQATFWACYGSVSMPIVRENVRLGVKRLKVRVIWRSDITDGFNWRLKDWLLGTIQLITQSIFARF